MNITAAMRGERPFRGDERSETGRELGVDVGGLGVSREGRGLSRLVGETCDLTVSIPMVSDVESLNASVAAAVTLAEVARRRSVEV